MTRVKNILCLSNGHGEDAIAIKILEQLQLQPSAPEIAALPLVGEGHAYKKLNIPIVGRVKKMPSGGFIYMEGKQLWRDLRGGLLGLFIEQYRVVRQWGKTGGTILAVGDIVPLLLTFLSGADYVFVGTAKSEYYLQDEQGWLPKTSKLEKWLGSVYLPHERWLMASKRCKGIFPRDALTTEILQKYSLPALYLGNPMMDGLNLAPEEDREIERPLTILLLPGSRSPEAEENWQLIVEALASTIYHLNKRSLLFLAAISPELNLENLAAYAQTKGWSLQKETNNNYLKIHGEILLLKQELNTLILCQNAYEQYLQLAHVAIATSGTATEQFVGLGKPVFSFPGKGPQFTYAFAEAQTRLLGVSVNLLSQPSDVGAALKATIKDPDLLNHIADNGKRRMGNAGASERIARCIIDKIT